MIIQFIVWTCAILFAVTGVVTVLALVGVLKIKKEYMNKLFYSLILEVVAGCIFGFNTYLKNYSQSDNWNFVAITTPQINIANNDIDTIIVDTSYMNMLFNGVVQFDKSKDIKPMFEYKEGDQVRYSSELTVNPSGIYSLNIPISTFTNKTNCTIKAYLLDGDEIVKDYLINGYIVKRPRPNNTSGGE